MAEGDSFKKRQAEELEQTKAYNAGFLRELIHLGGNLFYSLAGNVFEIISTPKGKKMRRIIGEEERREIEAEAKKHK